MAVRKKKTKLVASGEIWNQIFRGIFVFCQWISGKNMGGKIWGSHYFEQSQCIRILLLLVLLEPWSCIMAILTSIPSMWHHITSGQWDLLVALAFKLTSQTVDGKGEWGGDRLRRPGSPEAAVLWRRRQRSWGHPQGCGALMREGGLTPCLTNVPPPQASPIQ